MADREPISTYLELRSSTETGEEASGLSHTPGGVVLLHVQELAASGEPRGGVTIVHDAGDHGGRYVRAADALAEAGWAVALPDLRGHGRSEGERGHSAGTREIVRDLSAVQDHLAYRLPDASKVLIGVGLGAVHALAFAVERPGSLAALALLSPWLSPRFEPPPQPSALTRFFKKPKPTDPGRIPVGAEQRSSDPEEQRAWEADDLTHDVITRHAAEQVAEAAQAYRLKLADVDFPVLCMFGAEGSLADPEDVRAFEGPDLEIDVIEGCRHDLLHDRAAELVIERLGSWLAARLPRLP